MKILLVEADYKNKYPPLGLMKISSYHKSIGDTVTFVNGKNKELKNRKWDRIYVTTLFTFYWKKTIDTIKYYYNSVNNHNDVYVGGVMATLLESELRKENDISGITIMTGLLDKPNTLGNEILPVDRITPDYSIRDNNKNNYLNYEYEVKNAYLTSTTKGCIRNCAFCAVSILEPDYCDYIDIKEQIHDIDDRYGVKRDLMLMDNNILASNRLADIVRDLIDLGFGKNNKSYINTCGKRKFHQTRRIDFNQGVDARLLSEEKIELLSKLEIQPLRIAFDHADEENIKIYKNAQRLAAKYGIKNLSNYILFNFNDTELNEEFALYKTETSIWSFPMKYMPISGEHCKDRKYIGKHWNAKMLRGVQCILNATHAVVGPKRDYFELAFGKSYDEFIELIYMPELFITKRKDNAEKINRWKEIYHILTQEEKAEFISYIANNRFPELHIDNDNIRQLYECYYK